MWEKWNMKDWWRLTFRLTEIDVWNNRNWLRRAKGWRVREKIFNDLFDVNHRQSKRQSKRQPLARRSQSYKIILNGYLYILYVCGKKKHFHRPGHQESDMTEALWWWHIVFPTFFAYICYNWWINIDTLLLTKIHSFH